MNEEVARATSRRYENDGLRKLCGCARRKWTKCDHPWHFNFAFRGTHHRYSLDRLYPEKRIRAKTEAQAAAERIRSEIREGTFRRPGVINAKSNIHTFTYKGPMSRYRLDSARTAWQSRKSKFPNPRP